MKWKLEPKYEQQTSNRNSGVQEEMVAKGPVILAGEIEYCNSKVSIAHHLSIKTLIAFLRDIGNPFAERNPSHVWSSGGRFVFFRTLERDKLKPHPPEIVVGPSIIQRLRRWCRCTARTPSRDMEKKIIPFLEHKLWISWPL
ncbi:hypothetical protein TNCV_2139351 [Trichonephila clavipes]|uniref:Uncharacterized protein n=1 Tax=Trichonephila clavipes TaxID=2585209 RepID=A0A8X6RWP4_TRICX|nr:hypothetical protein TNCV_2139351 [Trichonephila clavipes]